MVPVYAELVRRNRLEGLDLSSISTFNLDEYIGLARDDSRTFRAFMHGHLFGKVNIDASRTRFPDGSGNDADQHCIEFEAAIAAAGGIDLQILGIGLTGHIGFNEPGSALHSRTRTKALSEITRRQNSEAFGGINQVPTRAVTMGIGTILEARRCLLLATGAEKAGMIASAIEGPITATVPASALQFHARCTVIVDGAAASELRNIEYYAATWEQEPEWASYRERGF